MSAATEPRLARLLLRLVVRGPDAEFVLGDLSEEFQRIVEERGAGAARRWYARQAVATAWSWLARGRRGAGERWWRELRLALRGLRRAPAYTAATLLTLSVGIAGPATVGALAHSILRPLPYPEPERLVAVWETREGRQRWVSPANYLDWRREALTFEGLAAHDTRGVSVAIDGVVTRERVAVVSGNFFEVLGVDALRGRVFDPGFEAEPGERVAVLSRAAWTGALASDPGVVGRTLRFDDVPHRVVGVAPPALEQPEPGLFAWLRAPREAPGVGGFDGDVTRLRDSWYLQVIGRLASGRSLADARSEMDAITARLRVLHPVANRSAGAQVIPLLEQSVAAAEPMLWALGAAVALLLLAAAVNVTHLVLARAAGRTRAAAIRVSLGARPSDLRRLLVIEAGILALGGASLGLLWARLALELGSGLTASLPRAAEIGVRAEVVPATLALALGVGTAVALLAHRAAMRSLGGASLVRAGSTGAPGLGRSLVAVQVAAAIGLLSGTALMARSVAAVARVDLGFEPVGLATLRVSIPHAAGLSYEERIQLHEAARTALAARGDVRAAAYGVATPLESGPSAGVLVVGEAREGDPPDAGWQPVHPDYFAAFGMTLRAGRAFAPSDRADAPDVAVVNERFAEVVLGGRDPVGVRVTMGLDGHDRPLTIVGVVADTRTRGPTLPAGPVLYRPIEQTVRYPADDMLFAARAATDRRLDATEFVRTVRQAAPGLPVYAPAAGEDLVRPFRRTRNVLLATLAVFAISALLLGLVGVYGVTAHAVRRGRREIGVRMALGADRRRVTAHVVGRGLRSALPGLPVGIGLALLLGQVLKGLLFEVPPTDAATLAGAAALVLVAVTAALWLPGRAAAATDPAEVTRDA